MLHLTAKYSIQAEFVTLLALQSPEKLRIVRKGASVVLALL